MKLVKCLPKIKQCCCCFSVRAGSIIIAIFEIIFMSVFGIASVIQVKSDHANTGIIVLNAIIFFLSPFIAVLLLLGIIMTQKVLVLIWIFYTYVKIVFLIISAIWNIVTISVTTPSIALFAITFLLTGLIILLAIYWVSVVGSYYNETFDNEDEEDIKS